VILLGALFMVIWFIQVGLRLFKLGSLEEDIRKEHDK
jgi:hypothetical protein